MIAPHVPFDELSEAHLQALVEERAAERRTLEFKTRLPSGDDEAKREFLADVSSLANAGGGDLVFGIKEEAGEATELNPLTFDADAEQLRLEQIVRSGVDPRIPGIRPRVIRVAGGAVLVLRIPRSWVGPHAVTYKGSFRFFTRTSAGKYQLDVRELRAEMLASSSRGDATRQFHLERLARIVADEGPIRLNQSARIIVHLIPLGAVSDTALVPLEAVRPSGVFWLLFSASGGSYTRWNIDGLLTYDTRRDDNIAWSYSQLFRNGIFEGVDSGSLTHTGHQQFEAPVLHGDVVEHHLDNGLKQPLRALELIGVQPPLVLFVTLSGVRDYLLATGEFADHMRELHRVDRDTISLPEAVIEGYDDDLAVTVEPLVDAFWQSGGFPGRPPTTPYRRG